MTLHAPRALLPGGWARDVRVSVDRDGRIEQVEISVPPAAQDQRLSRHTLLPAPSNLHSHAFQRAMFGRTQRRGPGADSFWSWRTLMYRFLQTLTPDMVAAITAQAQVEMCEAGYAAVAEFHYLHHAPDGTAYANPAETSERIMQAARETGIGLTLLPVIYAAGGADGRPPRGGQLRFACTPDRYEHVWQCASSALASGPADWAMGIAPHSLRAVPRDHLRSALEAHPHGPVHIHVAEQTAEVDEIQAAWGAPPVAWLLDHHAVNERWCLVHATHLQPTECDRLAASGAVAGLCPITEADLGDGIFPGERFVGTRGHYGVGTDANARITFAGELRALEYSQRLLTRQRNVLTGEGQSTGRSLFDAALVGGARALGRHSGAIEAGRLADLLALDTSCIDFQDLEGDDLLDGWIFNASGRVVCGVWSAGRQVVKDGRHIARDAVETKFRDAMRELIAAA